MSRKVLLISGVVILCLALFFMWLKSNTKKNSPPATATFTQNDLVVTINYCRPAAKSRVIFGDGNTDALQPYGKYWRMGANEATTIELNKAVMFNDKQLPPGKYSLYAYPGKESWTIGVNSDHDRWGAQEADKDKDVFRTMVFAMNDAPFEEQFLISFDPSDSLGGTNINLHWDKTLVKIPMRGI